MKNIRRIMIMIALSMVLVLTACSSGGEETNSTATGSETSEGAIASSETTETGSSAGDADLSNAKIENFNLTLTTNIEFIIRRYDFNIVDEQLVFTSYTEAIDETTETSCDINVVDMDQVKKILTEDIGIDLSSGTEKLDRFPDSTEDKQFRLYLKFDDGSERWFAANEDDGELYGKIYEHLEDYLERCLLIGHNDEYEQSVLNMLYYNYPDYTEDLDNNFEEALFQGLGDEKVDGLNVWIVALGTRDGDLFDAEQLYALSTDFLIAYKLDAATGEWSEVQPG